MGTPTHYASELPQRLGFLVDKLYPIVQGGLEGDRDFGGPLGTTFLLAMATPMLVLPIERILHVVEGKRAMGDDQLGNIRLANKIARAFAKGNRFDTLPFLDSTSWSYVANVPRFDIARNWPAALLHALGEPSSHAALRAADAVQILKDIRNALSHGGITYLNADGQHVFGDEVAMLAFAGHVSQKGDAYNIVRVSEPGFRKFLSTWSRWLVQ